MYKRILVAVDGSRTAEAALQEALALAAERHAWLRVVHVVDSPYSYPDVLYGEVPGDLETVRLAWRKAGEEILARAAGAARTAGVEAEAVLLESDGRRVSNAIVDDAHQWHADLLVVGTHGRRGLDRLLLGSVAEGIARTSPVSVLLVRGAER